jgi:hypothetical protein
MATEDTAVRNAAELDAKNGTMVEVFGRYEQVAGGKRPDAPLDGHAAVRLADDTLIWLEPPWHPAAIRAPEELAKFEGKEVVAKGLLFAECPPPPDHRAYAKVSCLGAGPIVMERATYDLLNGGELE